MGYRIITDVTAGYEPRPGLEGPYGFNGRVLYYDPGQGQYWDPRTDFYLTHQEFQQLTSQ